MSSPLHSNTKPSAWTKQLFLHNVLFKYERLTNFVLQSIAINALSPKQENNKQNCSGKIWRSKGSDYADGSTLRITTYSVVKYVMRMDEKRTPLQKDQGKDGLRILKTIYR